MKILYIHQHFATPKMPGITRTFEFARRLVQAGHEVTLITADQRFPSVTHSCKKTIEEGITVYWIPIPYSNKMGFYRRMFAFIKFALQAGSLGLKLTADILYVSSPPLTTTLPGVFISKRKKIPLILEVRDLWPDLPIAFGVLRNRLLIRIARAIEKIAYRNSTHIIALSPGMKLGISQTGFPSDKITVIPNCCDHDLFHIPESAAQSFRSLYPFLGAQPFGLYAGTLGEANGVSYLVHLASCFNQRNYRFNFLVIGDGKETELIRQTAIQLGVLNVNFFMLPELPKSEVPKAFAAATIIFNTLVDKRPLWNSSPNKFFDALAAHRPVAINFDGWLANLLRSTNAGVVLDPKSYEKASDLLAEKLSDKVWLEAANLAAGRLGKEQFSRDKIFDKFETVFLMSTETSREFGPVPKKQAR